MTLETKIAKTKYDMRDSYIKKINKLSQTLEFNIENIKGFSYLINILKDCVLHSYTNDNINIIVDKIVYERSLFETNKGLSKDQQKYNNCVVSLFKYAKIIKQYNKYQFLCVAAIANIITVYTDTHSNAWLKVSEYVQYSMNGNVSSVICISKNDENIGAFDTIEAMFKPITKEEKKSGVYGLRVENLYK